MILLDSGAEVVLESDRYEVTEGVNSSVEVCATISSPRVECAVNISFNFCLGIGSKVFICDIMSCLLTLLTGFFSLCISFRRCLLRGCSSLSIKNDDRVENLAKILIIPERNIELDPRISVNSMYSVLEITDDPTDGILCVL